MPATDLDRKATAMPFSPLYVVNMIFTSEPVSNVAGMFGGTLDTFIGDDATVSYLVDTLASHGTITMLNRAGELPFGLVRHEDGSRTVFVTRVNLTK